MRRRRRSTVQHCPALALLLLIDTTGMIIGALQQSPFIPANTGGEAKEPGSDGAFAALLLAVAVLLQSDSVVSTAQPAEGDSLAAAAPAAGEDGAPPAPSSAQDETASPAAASPILGPAPAVFPAPIADTNSPAPAVPLAPANSPALAVRAPVDEKVAGAPPPPSEAAAVIAAPAPQPSDPMARAGLADRAAPIAAPLDGDRVEVAPVAAGVAEKAQKITDDSRDSSPPYQGGIAPKEAAQSPAPLTEPAKEIVIAAGEAPRLAAPLPGSDKKAPEKTADNEPLAPESVKDSSFAPGKIISRAAAPAPENSPGRDQSQPVRAAHAETVLAARASTQAVGATEVAPGLNKEAGRGEERQSIQERIHDAAAAPASNPAPAQGGAEQKSFNRDGHASPAFAGEKKAPAREPAGPQGFPLEAASARQETQSRAEAEPIPWRPTVERLAGDIASQVRIGAREAIIQLDPPELGKIKIDLRLEGDKVLAHIAADSPEAQSLLKNHLPELHQALQAQQVNLAEVRVWSGGGAAAGGNFAQNFNQAPGQRQPGGWPGGGAQTERGAAQEPARAQKFSGASGRVSVWA